MENINLLIKWLKEAKKTVFFGGAGVSTESGLKDFRSKDGLYNEKYDYPVEVMLSHDFFMDKTKDFYNFYKDKLNSLKYKPNITHYVLAKLEEKHLLDAIITQNIDGFHQQAGSKKVLELHGSIMRNYCMKCGEFYKADKIFNTKEAIPYCDKCGGLIKPDVVLYGEMLDNDTLKEAIREVSEADLLIIGGSSLNVYPASGLINYFRGKHLVLINKDKTSYDDRCDLVFHESIGNIFKEIEKEID